MARSIVLLAILASLIGLSCKDEVIVSGQDGLVNPQIQPRVTYSSPALNTVGPYGGWDDYPGGSHTFYIRFNKLMEPGSIYEGLAMRSPLRSIRFDVPYSYDHQLKSESFALEPVDVEEFHLRPHVGEVFTIEATRPLVDVNGNAIPAGILGSFEPEPYFRVRGASPDAGAEVTGGSSFFLGLNSMVDSSFYSVIVTDPPVPLRWSRAWFDDRVLMASLQDVPSGPFTVSLPAGVRDAEGHPLHQSFSWSITIAGFRVASVFSPNLLFSPVSFEFSSAVDAATVMNAVLFKPTPPGGYVTEVVDRALRVIPLLDFAPQTLYTVSVDSTLHSAGGSPLVMPASVTFTTRPFALYYSVPWYGATGVSPTEPVSLALTGRPDTSTVRSALSIDPPVTGTIAMESPSVVKFTPASGFLPMTTYVVTFDTTLRTISGHALTAPAHLTFTTGPAR